MPPKMMIRVGLIVLALSILTPLGCAHWLKTRQFEPVNMEVSLREGEMHATEFETNLPESYAVRFEVDYSNDAALQECSARPWGDVHWRVYRLSGGTVLKKEFWASSDDAVPLGWFTDGFHGRPGKYRLEWNVSPKAACLNALHPRLTVSADKEIYEQSIGLIRFASVLFDGAGVMLILRGLGPVLLGFLRIGQPLRIFPDLALRNVLPSRRRRPMPLIVNLPIFAPVWISILAILVTIFMVMLDLRLTPSGFLVHFDRPRQTVWEKSPWTETMSVYVDSFRRFHVNGQNVASQDLPERLKEELGRRMVWIVYFEADENARVSDAEYAMNTIQHLGAKLVWLTPKTRKELNQETIK
jgi:biopolymer transport protein ExbD